MIFFFGSYLAPFIKMLLIQFVKVVSNIYSKKKKSVSNTRLQLQQQISNTKTNGEILINKQKSP